MDEQRIIVDRLLHLVEDERCGGDRDVEARRVDRDALLGAEARVPLALERGTGKYQREVYVEENRANAQGRSFD